MTALQTDVDRINYQLLAGRYEGLIAKAKRTQNKPEANRLLSEADAIQGLLHNIQF